MTAVATWRCFTHTDNETCTATSPCFDCADALHAAEHAEPVDDCRTCKLRSLQLAPAVGQETRGRKFAPIGVKKSHNEWERGLATDSRGMPLLTMSGRQITVKEYGERKRTIEAARHRVANDPHAFEASNK